MKKKILLTLLTLFSLFSLTSCGIPAEEKEVIEMISSTNSDIIMQSKIINPYALINAFNTDLDRAINNFNSQKIAIKISPNQIMQGTLVIPNSDGTQTQEEGMYVRFDEGGYLNDSKEIEKYNKENPSRTSFICSIDSEDYRLLEYAGGTANGTYVDTYYLIGSLSAVVGNEKYNLFAKDCRLIPAPTVRAIEVPQPALEQSSTLDVTSSENILYQVNTSYIGTNDYNDDGLSDVLNIAIQNAEPTSGFDKVIDNGITKKVTSDLSSIAKLSYNNINYGFKIPYPVKLSNPTYIKSSGIEGCNVHVLTFLSEGKDKTDIGYAEKEAQFKNVLPGLVSNPLYMTTATNFVSIGKDSISPFTVKLLDGTETTSVASDRIYFKSVEIDGIGNITGDIYVKTNNPFSHYYKTQFRIINQTTIEEIHTNEHNFYDSNYFELNDVLQPRTEGFKLKKDLPVALNKKVFVSYKINKTSGELTTGTGLTKEEDTVEIIKCNTGDYINFLSLENIDGQYWINAEYLYGEGKKKTCYIPIVMEAEIMSANRNIEVMGTSYKLDDLFYFGN